MKKRTVYQPMANWGLMGFSEPIGEATPDKGEAIYKAKRASELHQQKQWHTVDRLEEVWNEAEGQWECEDCVQVFDARD